MLLIFSWENYSNMDLLLITYEYPFGTGETFLESEVNFLAESFKKIWILPARSVWASRQRMDKIGLERELPNNFNLYYPKVRKVSDIVKGVQYCLSIRLVAKLSDSNAPYWVREKMAFREALKAGLLIPHIKYILKHKGFKSIGYSYWMSEAAIALAYCTRKKILAHFVSRCHGGDLYDEILSYPFRPYRQFICNYADYIIPISEHGRAYLIDKGVPKEKIAVQRLGVKRGKCLASGSKDGCLRIVSCSNLIPVKRVDFIAEALANLRRPFSWVHFGDGPEKERVMRIVSMFPSHGRVFFPGRISNSSVLQYYREQPVDVFINLSLSEGVPVSIMEALAHGIPCIATDVGGTSELVDDSCGILLSVNVALESIVSLLSEIDISCSVWVNKRNGALSRWREKADADYNYKEFSYFLQQTAHKPPVG